jgi:hypothetical protein
VHTARAAESFPISGIELKSHPVFINALAAVKQASGTANRDLGLLDRPKARAIIAACEDIRAGRLHEHFILDMIQGGLTGQHLRDLEPERRHATLDAVVLDTQATLIDEIIDLHDRFTGAVFSKAKRTHSERFQDSGKAISDKVRLYSRIGRALMSAKESGTDPFVALEAVIPWDAFGESGAEAEQLAGPANFDHLVFAADGFSQLRRYAPAFLDALDFRAAPAARDVLAAVTVLRDLNAR